MIRSRQYRLFGILMAALFCVFSIGVPVVLASCPMMGGGAAQPRLACCADAPASSGQSLSAYKDTSCCATKLAATRNTEEFVQAAADLLKAAGAATSQSSGVLPASAGSTVPFFAGPATHGSPPGRSVNLPVLHSALLI